MINTVPSSVTLSDIIKPIPVKPKIYFGLTPEGKLQVTGEVRVSGINAREVRLTL
jgi:hypothetical protein